MITYRTKNTEQTFCTGLFVTTRAFSSFQQAPFAENVVALLTLCQTDFTCGLIALTANFPCILMIFTPSLLAGRAFYSTLITEPLIAFLTFRLLTGLTFITINFITFMALSLTYFASHFITLAALNSSQFASIANFSPAILTLLLYALTTDSMFTSLTQCSIDPTLLAMNFVAFLAFNCAILTYSILTF
ncbi:MAG: hypothetical protein EZS28_006726 [Streblomastix strix]|uniref:Uncharacterized protein n=1 Tax=Streblomastix strix TaxID=222440 RepID=A0A5J4WS51_9EUKA|nr:MAG: hypothetical protein EZS28_006726 [Streblomastix strix]